MTAFLFSVDVEEAGQGSAAADASPMRAPELVERYLAFLADHRAKGTFFIVGEVARRAPGLVRTIAAEGHEIGCHSDRHVPLERLGREAFREDTLRNLDALAAAGAPAAAGYRAPCFSLTGRTAWAHDVLAGLGFRYSSSVLPAPSPIYGWPGFGRAPRRIGGLWEIPISLLPLPLPPLPSAGGVYFRALPRWIVRRGLRSARRRESPVAGYFHPYDIDENPPVRADFGRNRLFEWLLHRNRDQLFDRLDMAAALGFTFEPFGVYADRLHNAELRPR